MTLLIRNGKLLNHSFRRLNQEGIRLVDMREVVNAIFYLLLSWLFMGDAAPWTTTLQGQFIITFDVGNDDGSSVGQATAAIIDSQKGSNDWKKGEVYG